ncbi:hypothetical protein Trco_004385 [Trichoderma cornu-damae]|uniref:Uncharacterized protein n=1 Tax=Trichoderma cornu-damae TaxID=654480 RepID=A0A9P8QSZ9_9HYPO|nr:hypothetical protein Trco_004385 [Trichoderma cornu-damae]
MRDLLSTSDDADLVNGSNLGAQPAVDAEKLPVNDGGKDEEVKDVATRFPYRCVAVFLLAFFVEAVHLRDLARFVVPSDENDAVRCKRLQAKVPSIDVVPEKNEAGFGALRRCDGADGGRSATPLLFLFVPVPVLVLVDVARAGPASGSL